MTECSTDAVQFSTVERKNLVADFQGGRMTSDAGLLLLREVEQQLQLFDRIDNLIHDPRDQEVVVHKQRDMLAQRIMGLAAGYEDLNDHQELRNDPALQASVNNSPEEDSPLASPSTLCRLENRIKRKELVAMNKLFVELFIESFDTPPEEIILDFDATDCEIHGEQEGRFYHGYYDNYCFLPLYVFAGEQILCAYLRSAKIDGASHAGPILALLTKRLRAAFPDVRIVFRGDSGFCRPKLLGWCERHDVNYIVGIAQNKRLNAQSDFYHFGAETQYLLTGERQRLFGEIQYAAKSWRRERRIIVKSEHSERGSNPRYVVTNLSGDAQQLYDEVYCARGDMENRIKEQQRMLWADRTSCHEFHPNQYRLLLSGFAYVLMETFRRTVLNTTPLKKAQVSTIRLKLFKIGARVTVSVRRVVFHMSSSYPYQELYHAICDRLLGRDGLAMSPS